MKLAVGNGVVTRCHSTHPMAQEILGDLSRRVEGRGIVEVDRGGHSRRTPPENSAHRNACPAADGAVHKQLL